MERVANSAAQLRSGLARITGVALAAALLVGLAGAEEVQAQQVDVSGTWALEVTTQQGTSNPTVTLQQEGQDLTGQYSSAQLGEAEVTGSVEGNEVTFSFTASVGGQSAPVTYTGTVDGDSMSGNLDLGGMMTATFTGTREEGS